MTNIKNRLEFYLKSKRISKAEFGRRIDVSNAYITSIKKSVSPEKLQKIKCEFPDLNIDWLMTGEGEMIKALDSGNNITVGHDANNINSNVTITKLIDEMAAQRKSYEELMKAQCEQHDQHINRLLNIIEERLPK